jgi:hypothetical protein
MVAASQTKEGWRLPFRALVFAGLVLDISGMENENNAPPLTPQEFAHLGAGAVAYVRPVDSEDVQRLFPQAPQLRPGVRLLALMSADGSPLVLTNTTSDATRIAWEHELETVSLH